MKWLDLTLPTPAENLACDEALLDRCEDEGAEEILRFWEPRELFVVAGYANRIGLEVNVEACAADGIPVLRRCSGGGTVLQGPGCLNYSLVLKFEDGTSKENEHPTSNDGKQTHLTPDTPHLISSESTFNIQHSTFNTESRLQSIPSANRFIMERNRAAIESLLSRSSRRKEAPSSRSQTRKGASPPRGLTLSTVNSQPDDQSLVTSSATKSLVLIRGHTDLAIGGLKFSGNAQRRRKRFLLFHGTFLLNFDIAAVAKCLRMPSRQPDYRQDRSHADFLANLGVSAPAVKEALREAWQANDVARETPGSRIEQLVRDKYVTMEWNLKFE